MGRQAGSARAHIRQWSLAAASTATAVGICASPLFAATPSAGPTDPSDAMQQAKNGTHRQTAKEFEQALGVPLEDAGGGWHAVLTGDAENLEHALRAGGFSVNGMALDYKNKQIMGYLVGRMPDAATLAQYSRQAASHGFSTRLVGVYRSVADAEKQHASIDRAALAAHGIELGVTGVDITTGLVRVDVYDGTQAKADYLKKTYGPAGLEINIGEVPHPHEAPLHGPPPPAAR